jgi:hypothetical protein
LYSDFASYLNVLKILPRWPYRQSVHRTISWKISRRHCAILSISRIPLMLRPIKLIVLPALSFTALTQTPISHVGKSCPTGTYRSRDYCRPNKSDSDQVIIEKVGKHCPTGFYASGNYCKRYSDSDRGALPRESGESFPSDWRKSGEYCVKI